MLTMGIDKHVCKCSLNMVETYRCMIGVLLLTVYNRKLFSSYVYHQVAGVVDRESDFGKQLREKERVCSDFFQKEVSREGG